MNDTTKLLNQEQQVAIKHVNGPLLIIAGAGTGKTTVITEKIKYLVLDKNIHPSQILALTFTEKASREMEERVDVAMPYGYTQMWIATFHAFCDRILRNEAIHIGLTPAYKLMTEAETILFLRKNLFSFNLAYFRPLGNPHKFLEGLIQHFSRLRDEDIQPAEYLAYAEKLSDDKDVEKTEIEKTLELANAYEIYEKLKTKEGVMDFSDLISNTLKLFRERKNILKSYQEQFHYILVDEFQDTNFAQNTLALMLAGEKKNIAVVGDDDQAIYRWRGAAISNMVQFRKTFPNAKIVTLTKNYRSTQEILDRSYKLIQQNNPDRLEIKENVIKKLTSAKKTKDGLPIELLFADRVEEETELVTKKIQELIATKKFQYKDVAILVRANDHAAAFTRTLSRYNIPFQFLGPGKLFHQEEIKDLIAYLKVLYNFEDGASLYRVLCMPIFDITARDISALLNLGKRKNYSLFESIEKSLAKEPEIIFPQETVEKLQKVYNIFQRHLKRVSKDTAGQILYMFLEDSGLLKKFLSPVAEIDEKRSQNIAKFFGKLKMYESAQQDASVYAVVDWIDLAMQMGESPLATDTDWSQSNAVNLLTVHSSKGLEFPIVFLVNLVGQRFPTRERREQIPIPNELIKEILPEGDFHLQEERRLFYVGMTRACDRLFFSAANFYGEGKRERKLSPFVMEALGEEYVEKLLNREKNNKVAVQESLLDWAFHSSADDENEKTKSRTILPLTYVSYSQLQCFDICPLHYKMRYIVKIPTPPSAAQSFGTCIHATLRDIYLKAIRKEKVTIADVQTLLNNVWINEGYQSKEHEKAAKERALFLITNYMKKYFHTDSKTPIGLEIPFMFYIKNPDNPSQSLKIGGRIDRVDKLAGEKIEIIDYKTGSNVPGENDVAKDLQLTVYALAASLVREKIFNKPPENVLLSLYYIEEDTKLTTTRTKEQLEEVKKTLFAKADEIVRSDYKCSGSALCKNCEYKILCSST